MSPSSLKVPFQIHSWSVSAFLAGGSSNHHLVMSHNFGHHYHTQGIMIQHIIEKVSIFVLIIIFVPTNFPLTKIPTRIIAQIWSQERPECSFVYPWICQKSKSQPYESWFFLTLHKEGLRHIEKVSFSLVLINIFVRQLPSSDKNPHLESSHGLWHVEKVSIFPHSVHAIGLRL